MLLTLVRGHKLPHPQRAPIADQPGKVEACWLWEHVGYAEAGAEFPPALNLQLSVRRLEGELGPDFAQMAGLYAPLPRILQSLQGVCQRISWEAQTKLSVIHVAFESDPNGKLDYRQTSAMRKHFEKLMAPIILRSCCTSVPRSQR